MESVEITTSGYKKDSKSNYNFTSIDSYLVWLKHNKNRPIYELKVNGDKLPTDSFRRLLH